MPPGWSAHPGARPPPEPLPPIEDGHERRIVGLGASCDLDPHPDAPHTQSFAVREFVVLDDGRRVTLHDERGFTIGSNDGDLRTGLTAEGLEHDVRCVVLPDDDATAAVEEHPWPWLVELARARGLDATEAELRALPYDVVLSTAVLDWLAEGSPPQA